MQWKSGHCCWLGGVQAAVQTIVAQNRLANISKLVAAGQAQPGQLLSNSEDMKRMTAAAK